MTQEQVRDLIRFNTKTDSNSFPDAEVLLLLNIAIDEIAKEIIQVNEDYFGERSFRDLEAGRREYRFPMEILSNIKAVEAIINGEDQVRLTEADLNMDYKGTMDEESIRENLFGKPPRYMLYRSALWILSEDEIQDVEEGLILWHMKYPEHITEFTDRDMVRGSVATERGIPRQFHELLGRRVSILYKASKPRPIPLNERENLYEYDLEKALRSIRGLNLDRSIIASYPKDTGSNY